MREYYQKAKRLKIALEHIQNDNTVGGKAIKRILTDELGGPAEKVNVAVEGFFDFLFGKKTSEKDRLAKEEEAKQRQKESQEKLLEKLKSLSPETKLLTPIVFNDKSDEDFSIRAGNGSKAKVTITPQRLETELKKLLEYAKKCDRLDSKILTDARSFAKLLKDYETDAAKAPAVFKFVDATNLQQKLKQFDTAFLEDTGDYDRDYRLYFAYNKGAVLGDGCYAATEVLVLEGDNAEPTSPHAKYKVDIIDYVDTDGGELVDYIASEAIVSGFTVADCTSLYTKAEAAYDTISELQAKQYAKMKSSVDLKYIRDKANSGAANNEIGYACWGFISLFVELPLAVTSTLDDLEYVLDNYLSLLKFIEKEIVSQS